MSQLYTRYALEADQIRFSISIFIGKLGGTRCVGSALYDNCQVESISQTVDDAWSRFWLT